MHLLVKALADRDWEDAAALVAQDPEDPWDEPRFEAALAPFFAEYAQLIGPTPTPAATVSPRSPRPASGSGR